MNQLTYHTVTTDNVSELMMIENSCHSHPWSEKVFRSCIGGRYFGHFAKQDHHLIGFYIGEYVCGEATLMDICIAPEQQGKGLGNALTTHFIEQSNKKGAEKIWLEVRASNISAMMLYINHGFIETGRRTGYYPKEVGYEDAIVMCKTS